MTDLGTLGGKASAAYAINAAGNVVGWSETADPPTGDGPVEHAFLYRAGKMTDLGTWGRRCSQAHAINDAGRVAGVVYDRKPLWTPFVLAEGKWTGVGDIAGAGLAGAIDAAGDLTGSAQSPEDGGEYHAFLFKVGRRYDLGTLGGKVSYGYGFDRAGRVLGGSRTAAADDARLHAFVHDANVLHDLNRLIPADARCVLLAARAADAKGVIVGEADFPDGRHAVLLTPDPPRR